MPEFVSALCDFVAYWRADLPLYCIVAKFSPCKFGNKKVFLSAIHVPSPTSMVLESYVELPGADASSAMLT